MAWYFQTSPHDMHDWDSAQTPILIDGVVNGRRRKLVSTAARNGYFFTVDRVTGEGVVSSKYGSATNWVKSIDKNGSLRRDPGKDPTVAGSLVSPTAGGTVNWEPPAFSPADGTVLRLGEEQLSRSSISPIPIRAAPWGWAGRKK